MDARKNRRHIFLKSPPFNRTISVPLFQSFLWNRIGIEWITLANEHKACLSSILLKDLCCLHKFFHALVPYETGRQNYDWRTWGLLRRLKCTDIYTGPLDKTHLILAHHSPTYKLVNVIGILKDRA